VPRNSTVISPAYGIRLYLGGTPVTGEEDTVIKVYVVYPDYGDRGVGEPEAVFTEEEEAWCFSTMGDISYVELYLDDYLGDNPSSATGIRRATGTGWV
jgi:hypothetical protein